MDNTAVLILCFFVTSRHGEYALSVSHGEALMWYNVYVCSHNLVRFILPDRKHRVDVAVKGITVYSILKTIWLTWNEKLREHICIQWPDWGISVKSKMRMEALNWLLDQCYIHFHCVLVWIAWQELTETRLTISMCMMSMFRPWIIYN